VELLAFSYLAGGRKFSDVQAVHNAVGCMSLQCSLSFRVPFSLQKAISRLLEVLEQVLEQVLEVVGRSVELIPI